MAVQIPNGKQSFIDSAGNPLVGGKLYTYAAGTNVPKLTWSDAAGTVPNTNPIVLDARGEATIFWLGTYKIELHDALNNLIWTVDQVVAATIDQTLRADLAASTGLAMIGTKLTGVGGAKVRTAQAKMDEMVNITDFAGVVGDGATDCSDGIIAALAWAAAQGGNITFYVPKGSYKITKTITVTAPGIYFVGQNKWACTWLSTVLNGPTFDFNGALNGGMSDLASQYLGTPSAGAIFYYFRNGSYTHVYSDMRSVNCWTWFQIGNDPATGEALTGDISILRPIGTAYNGGQPFIYGRRGVGLWLDSPRCPVGGPNTPISPSVINRDPANVITVVPGTTFLKIEGTFDTINLTGNGLIEHFDHGVWLNSLGNGEIIQNFEMQSGWFFDYHQNQAFYVTAAAGLGGILGCHFRGYALSWGSNTMEISAAGLVRDVTWIDPINYVAGKCNFKMSGTNHFFCGITGDGSSSLEAANRINGGYASVDISGGQYPIVQGITGGIDGTYGGYAWQPPKGLKWGPDIIQPKFIGNRFLGISGGFDWPTNTIGTGAQIFNNSGQVNYAGPQPFTLPASGTIVTNMSGFRQIYYITQGTGVVILNNGALVGLGNCTVQVEDGDTIKFTYTTPPTVSMVQIP